MKTALNHSHPLVTFCFMTYNQELYVREALSSVLEQDYDNLEIIISDDCSRDGTWAIIERVVGDFRKSGCRHRLVLNRNKQNLGIAAHWDLVESMCHGELKFMAAGDDVSMPNRASRVVEAWLENGKRATAVIHSGYEIDTEGNHIGSVRPTSLKLPMGAVMAWKRFPELKFKSIGGDGVEDVIYAARARILGDELIIPDKLLLYRVGSGLSTGLKSQREPAIRGFRLWKGSLPQMYADLETLRSKISDERYGIIREDYRRQERIVEAHLTLLQSKVFVERIRAFIFLRKYCSSILAEILLVAYLMPRRLGDFLLNEYVTIKFLIRRKLAR